MTRYRILVAALALAAVASVRAADDAGWTPLFDGKSLAGWTDKAGNAPGKGWAIEDGALVRKDKGAGDLWTKARYGNFVLDLEFKTAGNSGVFIRTDSPKDNVQTGIEVQIDNPSEKPHKNGVGAIYDCLAPTKVAAKKDEWNRMVITAKDNVLKVAINGELVIDMDLNQWTEPGKNPDGTKNKFKTPLKDFKREGHIGLQDHGAAVMFRNMKIQPMGK
jgi:hypothetical protein